MTREEAIQVLKDTYAHWLRLQDEDILPCSECEKVTEAIDTAISALSVIEQTKWERDTALATLEEHGIGLGQKANATNHENEQNCGDLISRAELRKAFCKINDLRTLSLGKVGEIIDSVPSADAPTIEPSDLISRHEALMELNGACSNWQDDATVAEIIHALPSVSVESKATENKYDCDLISRAEVKKLATKFFGHWVVFENRIDNLPSVSAERVGEWIKPTLEYDKKRCDVICPFCHTGFWGEPNYCSHCGAKMKGGTE